MSPNYPLTDPPAPGGPPQKTVDSLREYVTSLRGYSSSAWKAAIACVLAMALSPAALNSTITFFVEPVARDFGWSQSQTLTIFSVPTIAAPFLLPLTGRWVDRWGARAVAVPGAALYALATAAVALTGANVVVLLLTLFAATAFGYVAIMGVFYKVVAEWFPHHRGSGYSLLIGAACSLGGAVLAPLVQLSVHDLGWRPTYFLLALGILVIVFPAQFFLLSEPRRDGADSSAGKGLRVRTELLPGTPLGAALRSPGWLLLVAVMVVIAAVVIGVRLNAVSLFGERGYSPTAVSLSLSVLLVASIGGQIAAGVVMDRSRSARAFVPFVACLVAGTVLIFAAQGGTLILLLVMCLLGMVMGAESSVGPYLVARYFGLRAFAQIQGITLGAVALFGVGVPPVLIQKVAESAGSYTGPLIALTAASLLALALIFLLPRYPAGEKHESAATDEAQSEAV